MGVKTLPDYDWVECELSCYRKGFISVRLDFARHILVWKESNRWFNNFVRGLSKEKLALLQEALDKFLGAATGQTQSLAERQRKYVWHLTLGKEECETPVLELRGDGGCDEDWRRLAKMLETVSERSMEF